jgi:hypothetical protein
MVPGFCWRTEEKLKVVIGNRAASYYPDLTDMDDIENKLQLLLISTVRYPIMRVVRSDAWLVNHSLILSADINYFGWSNYTDDDQPTNWSNC